jgi:hypothetical protein
MPQGVASGRRQGKSRAALAYHVRIRSTVPATSSGRWPFVGSSWLDVIGRIVARRARVRAAACVLPGSLGLPT